MMGCSLQVGHRSLERVHTSIKIHLSSSSIATSDHTCVSPFTIMYQTNRLQPVQSIRKIPFQRAHSQTRNHSSIQSTPFSTVACVTLLHPNGCPTPQRANAANRTSSVSFQSIKFKINSTPLTCSTHRPTDRTQRSSLSRNDHRMRCRCEGMAYGCDSSRTVT